MIRQSVAIGFGFFALLSACSSTTSSGDACSSYVDAAKSREVRCKDSSSELRSPEFPSYCAVVIGAPGAGTNAERLSACASRLKELPCNLSASDVSECRSSNNIGSLADGAACASDNQCASSNCDGGGLDDDNFTCGKCAASIPVGGACDQSGKSKCAVSSSCVTSGSGGTTGTCVAVTIANEGELCATTDKPVRCADGFRCSSAGDERATCRRPLAEGAACTGHECGGELACISSKCQLRGGAGTPCVAGNECERDFTCDDASKKCVAVVKVGEGQPCGGTTVNPPRCNDGLYCPSSNSGGAGTCKAYKAKGADCVAGVDKCTPFTACLAGKCALPDPATCK